MTFRPDAISRGLLVIIFLLLIILTAKEFYQEKLIPYDFNKEDQEFIFNQQKESSVNIDNLDTDSTISRIAPVKKTPIRISKKEKQHAQIKIININTASASELTSLTGIGDKMAMQIIEYRTTNGKFNTLDDLKKVKGIGEKKYEKIKASISL